MALAKREAARRGLYSRFFRGPVLGPDVQSQTVETEATVVSQALGDNARAVTEKRSKNKSKVDPSGDALTEEANEEAKRQKKLRKMAERAAKKLHRRKEKERGQDERNADEMVPSIPQEQASEVSAFETTHEMSHKRQKKNKRRKESSADELDVTSFERTLVVEVCKDSKNDSMASRKKRRRDE